MEPPDASKAATVAQAFLVTCWNASRGATANAAVLMVLKPVPLSGL